MMLKTLKIRWKYNFISMENWMNIEYKYVRITNIVPLSVALKQFNTSFYAPFQKKTIIINIRKHICVYCIHANIFYTCISRSRTTEWFTHVLNHYFLNELSHKFCFQESVCFNSFHQCKAKSPQVFEWQTLYGNWNSFSTLFSFHLIPPPLSTLPTPILQTVKHAHASTGGIRLFKPT